MNKADEMLQWCVETIQKYDEERQQAMEKGAGPQGVAQRLTNLEERLEHLDSRLGKIEGMKALQKKEEKKDDDETEKKEE